MICGLPRRYFSFSLSCCQGGKNNVSGVTIPAASVEDGGEKKHFGNSLVHVEVTAQAEVIGITQVLVKSGRLNFNNTSYNRLPGVSLAQKRRILHVPQCKWAQKVEIGQGAVCQFGACALGSTQFKVTDVTALR